MTIGRSCGTWLWREHAVCMLTMKHKTHRLSLYCLIAIRLYKQLINKATAKATEKRWMSGINRLNIPHASRVGNIYKTVGNPYNAADSRPKFVTKGATTGAVLWWCQWVASGRVYKALVLSVTISQLSSIQFLTTPFGEGVPLGVDDGIVGWGDGMFPWAVSTNHRCIWHHLAAIYNASFDWGVVSPQFGEWVNVGRRGLEIGHLCSPVVTSDRLPIVTTWAYLSPFLQCSDMSRTDGRTDARSIIAKLMV